MRRFATVVVDPPWPMKGFNGWGKRRVLPYKSMSVDEIASLCIAPLVASEGYVFLWATNAYLPNAFDVLDAWGLVYRQPLVWCKEECAQGLGGMFGSATEVCLVAQRIGAGTHAHGKRTLGQRIEKNWFVWPRRRHSEKPEEFFSMVEEIAPSPRLEIFARRRRAGWTSVGDGLDGRDVRVALDDLR